MQINPKKIIKRIKLSTIEERMAAIFTLVSSLLFIYAFREWLFHSSILTKGDWGFFFNNTLTTVRIRYFSIWFSDFSFGRVLLDVAQAPFYAAYGLFAKYFGLSYAISERVIHLLPAVILSIVFAYLLLRKIFPKRWVSIYIGTLVYSINTPFLVSLTGANTLATAFAFAPLIFCLFIDLLDTGTLPKSIIFGLICSVMTAYEPRAFYVLAIALSFFFLYQACFSDNKVFFIGIKRVIPGAMLFILTNFYWLLGLSKTKSIAENDLFSRELFGNSYWSLINSFTLHHPWWSGDGVRIFESQSIPVYFWLVPMIAFTGLILNRKNKKVIFFGALSLVGIFLSKQVDEPFSKVYPWLYIHIPGFNAFREASKFYPLVAISYSVLIASFFSWYFKRKSEFKNKYRVVFILLLIGGVFMWNLKPLINGSIGTLFVARKVPEDYEIFRNYLDNQKEYFRVFWVPRDSRWSDYTDIHPKISAVDILKTSWLDFDYSQSNALQVQDHIIDLFKQSFSEDIFNISSVKYVVVPIDDVENDDEFFIHYGGRINPQIREWYINELNKISFLKKIDLGTNSLVVYENERYEPYVFTATDVQQLDSNRNLDKKIAFIKNVIHRTPLFSVLNEEKDRNNLTFVAGIFDKIRSENINERIVATTTVPVIESKNRFFSRINNSGQLLSHLNRGFLTVERINSGSILINGLENSTSTDRMGVLLEKIWIGNYDTVYIDDKNSLAQLKNGQDVSIRSRDDLNELDIYTGAKNTIDNGSFESGSWQKDVGDCNKRDDNPILAMSLDDVNKTDGRRSLQLDATRHTACVSTRISLSEDGDYVLSFDYKSLVGQTAGFYLQFNDVSKTVVREIFNVDDLEWRHFVKRITVPKNVTNATLYIYSYSKDEKIKVTTHYDNVRFEKLILSKKVLIPKSVGYTALPITLKSKENHFEYGDSTFSLRNAFSNSSFEFGTWQAEIGDCNRYDDNPILKMSLDKNEKTDGRVSLQLEASRHVACTAQSIPVRAGSTYLLSFDYQSPNSKFASYYVEFNDPNKTSLQGVLPIQDEAWQSFSKMISVPKNASTFTLYVYARETDQKTNIINRYDNFKLIEVPDLRDAFYLVSEPTSTLVEPKSITFDLINPTKKQVHIKGTTTPFFLGMSESYHDQWQLQVRNEKIEGWLRRWSPFVKPDRVGDAYHYKLDGFLNAWYVDTEDLCGKQGKCVKNPDGSYDIEMTIEFWPQRWFYLGLLISGTTLAGCLGYLAFDGVRILRRKRKAKQTSV